METALVRYDAMCQAIAEAYAVDEVKQIRDQAIALEHYSHLAHNVEAESQCCRIRLRAERKAGELLKQMEKAKGAAQPGVGRKGGTVSNGTTPLSDLGISRDQSSKWQQLADVPEEQFEMALVGDKPTTAGILASVKPQHPVDAIDKSALWVWGRLQDFRREGILDRDPETICQTMLPHMRETLRELLPEVIFWLQGVEP